MYLTGKTICIAGATGMAGSALITYLLENYPNTYIRAIHHFSEPYILHPNIEYRKADLRLSEDCLSAVADCQAVIMAAAMTGGCLLSKTEPWKQVNHNLFMNAQLFEACHKQGVERVICIGSATLYQDSLNKLSENDLDLNQDPPLNYFGIGWVTRSVEKLAQFWSTTTSLPIICIRASNIYGPYAKFDLYTANFIPALIRKAFAKIDPFEVWGDKNVVRDVIYSADFASAVIQLLDHNQFCSEVFNICSGKAITVESVVNSVLNLVQHVPTQINYINNTPLGISYRLYDSQKIQLYTGWKIQNTLEQGLAKTVSWWQLNSETWQR
ncbi:MAG: UDP-glucose 4-epimerase [Chlamydiales bacterium]|jgi:GDP-L-fucose synthase|nr:UDP-glucose 4-epimerase [Chlamydiales bacterium]